MVAAVQANCATAAGCPFAVAMYCMRWNLLNTRYSPCTCPAWMRGRSNRAEGARCVGSSHTGAAHFELTTIVDPSSLQHKVAAFSTFADFLLEIDRLKNIERRSYIADGTRLENSAEHSWHVAMCAWALSNHLGWTVSRQRLLELALVHDLGEIESGDTFLYSSERHGASERERAAVARLAQRHRDLMPDLEALWDEQERGETKEARLLKIADRVLPFIHNLANGGRTWKEHGIRRSQVLAAHAFIQSDAPEVYEWCKRQLDEAVSKGWLSDS